MKSHLTTKQGNVSAEQRAKIFHGKMLCGKDVRGAVRYLTARDKGGVLMPARRTSTRGQGTPSQRFSHPSILRRARPTRHLSKNIIILRQTSLMSTSRRRHLRRLLGVSLVVQELVAPTAMHSSIGCSGLVGSVPNSAQLLRRLLIGSRMTSRLAGQSIEP